LAFVGVKIKGSTDVPKTAKEVAKSLGSMKDDVKSSSQSMFKSFTDLKSAFDMIFGAIKTFASGINNVIMTYDRQAKALAKTSAVIRSTGNVTETTTKIMADMAAELQNLTNIGDDVILNTQAILLTFRNIGKDIFPAVTKAALDMSATFDVDLRSAAIMLGKAFEDPVAGATALRRVGVTVSEQMKQMAKDFVDLGQIEKAQALLLGEVTKQVDGAAEAMAKAGAGSLKALQNEFGDAQEVIGKFILEGIQPLIGSLRETVKEFQEGGGLAARQFGAALNSLGQTILSSVKFVLKFRETIIAFVVALKVVPTVLAIASAAMTAFGVASSSALGPIGLVISGVTILVGLFVNLKNRADESRNQVALLQKQTADYYSTARAGAAGVLSSTEEYLNIQQEVVDKINSLKEAYLDANIVGRAAINSLIKENENLLASIQKNIQEQKDYDLQVEAIRGTLTDLKKYDEAINLITESLEKYKAAAPKTALGGAFSGEVNAYILSQEKIIKKIKQNKELVRTQAPEYLEMLQKKAEFEAEWTEKRFQLTASNLEKIYQEEKKALQRAAELGANQAAIYSYYYDYYAKLRIKITEKENKKIVEIFNNAQKLILSYAQKSQADRVALLTREYVRKTEELEKAYRIISERIPTDTSAAYKVALGGLTDWYREEIANVESEILRIRKGKINEYVDSFISATEGIATIQQQGIGVAQLRELESIGQLVGKTFEDETIAISANISTLNTMLAKYNQLKEAGAIFSVDLANVFEQAIPELIKSLEDRIKTVKLAPLLDVGTEMTSVINKYRDQLVLQKEGLEKDKAALTEYINSLKEKIKLVEDEKTFLANYGLTEEERLAVLKDINVLMKNASEALEGVANNIENVNAQLNSSATKIRGLPETLDEAFGDIFQVLGTIKEGLSGAFQGIVDRILGEGIEKYAAAISKNVENLTKPEKIEATTFAAAETTGRILLDLAQKFLNLILSTETMQTLLSDFNVILQQAVIPIANALAEALRPLLIMIAELVGTIAQILLPVFNMLGALIRSLEPLWQSLSQILIRFAEIILTLSPTIFYLADIIGRILAPIFNSLSVILSHFSGLMSGLMPVFNAFGIVIDALGRAFSSIIVVTSTLFGYLSSFGQLLFYIVTFQWGKIGNIQVPSLEDMVNELGRVWTAQWGPSQFESLIPSPLEQITVPELGPGGTTIYGGGTTVTQPIPVNVYVSFSGPIIGAGGMAEAGQKIVEAVEAYLGSGGQVNFLEA
jgi:hypothetical protein